MRLQFQTKTMEFLKPAKTSRGEYIKKTSILLSLSDNQHTGIGEASPLPDLSIDGKVDLAAVLSPLLDTELAESDLFDLLAHWEPGESEALPSLRFALHAAWKNLQFQQHNKPTSAKQTVHWANNDFTAGKRGLKINGLVWMNGVEAMYEEAISKFKAGFRCIKIKVGALDFDEECRLIERIRKHYTAFALELRLDANGGFQEDAALEQLKELKRFEIHSIEQPVRAGSPSLDQICRESPIDIALDESLIGIHPTKDGCYGQSGSSLLSWARPKYIILKPTLLGGTDIADAWIQVASKQNIGWWSTSALEGNVGLASIAQWVSQYQPSMPQGLGTGLLFKDNFQSYTRVVGDTLWFNLNAS